MSTAAQQTKDRLAQAIAAPRRISGSWAIEEAYKYCEQIARSHYENFPVGSLFVPKHLRKHFYAIYAFARTADDFADEGYGEGITEQDRLDLLAEWREMLFDSFSGRARHPVFVALAETRAEFDLPAALFEDLLSAFAQDVTVRRYRRFDDLIDYCRRSANPIGRLILLLFNHRSARLHEWSDDICTALQLANHWQDVAIDLGKDRIYLPAEDMLRFEVSEGELKQRVLSERFKSLMAYEVARARELFARGKPLCASVGGRLGLELRAVWLGGSSILDGIEASDYDIFSRRPVVTTAAKLRILFSAITKGGFRHD